MILMKWWSIIRCRMSTLLLLQFTTDNKIFIKKSILVFDIYILKRKSCLIEASRRPIQNSYVCKLWYTDRKKLSHFDIKSWVTCGIKIWPGKVGNWRIFESNWLNVESLIDSTLRVKLTQHWEYLLLVQHWEYNWLNVESQVESTLSVKLTQLWEFNWLKYSPFTHFVQSNYNSTSDSTFKGQNDSIHRKNWVILT